MIEFAADLQCQKYVWLQLSWYASLDNFLWYVKLSIQNIQLKIQHKPFKINGKPRKIYSDNYPTLTKQLELIFITNQVLIDNFLIKFLFKSVYKRNARLSRSKVHQSMLVKEAASKFSERRSGWIERRFSISSSSSLKGSSSSASAAFWLSLDSRLLATIHKSFRHYCIQSCN